MKKIFIPVLAITITSFGCQMKEENQNVQTAQIEENTNRKDANEVVSEATKSVTDLFSDFPEMNTVAKAGEHILVPSYKTLADYANDQTSVLIFYNAKMANPREGISNVAFTFDGEQEIPNQLIVPIPAGEKVKKGDIVLTWWQSGSGMQRAIVTDASNPSMPEVHYLDISWDNPAKSNGISIGQLKEQIKENTFTKITSEWQSGTTIAVMEGTTVKKYTVINVAGDKVLVKGAAGIVKIVNKSACTPLKINNKVKVGDRVQAPWVDAFKAGTVKEVKAEYGRAVIIFDNMEDKEYVIPFGDITTGLIL